MTLVGRDGRYDLVRYPARPRTRPRERGSASDEVRPRSRALIAQDTRHSGVTQRPITDRYDYIRDGAEIYRRLLRHHPAPRRTSRASRRRRSPSRCASSTPAAWSRPPPTSPSRPARCSAARAALQAGAPILCDAKMVANGVTRARLPADNEVICTLDDPEVPALAAPHRQHPHRRRHGALARPLGGAVVAIGNAPTALFRLLEMLDAGRAAPGRRHRHAGRLRRRGGIQGGADRRRARALAGRARPQGRQRHGGGRRQRRWRASANDHAPRPPAHRRHHGLPARRRPRPGRSRPADRQGREGHRRPRPSSPISAKAGRRGNARTIVEPWLEGRPIELPLVYPVTVEIPSHDPAYVTQLAGFYAEAAERHRRASRRRARRGAAVRGRPALLRLLHAPLCPAEGPLPRRDLPRRDRHVRLLDGGGRADHLGRRRADRAARHAAPRRLARAPRRHATPRWS